MESIECVLCERSESKPVIEDNGYVGRQCTRCGLIFVSPRPSSGEMDAMYEEGHAYLSPEFFVANPEFVSVRAHARREVKRLREYIRSGSLLEIGPGRGTFLTEARSSGFDAYGVELNPLQAEFIRTDLKIPCVESMDSIPSLGPERFDVIYHCSVLSHFHDPVAEFQRFYDLLSDGGYLMFETGNLADVDPKFFKYVSSFQYPDHLFFFGNQSINVLLNRTGFRVVDMRRYSTLREIQVRAQVTRLRNARADHVVPRAQNGETTTKSHDDAPALQTSAAPDRENRRVFQGPGVFARQVLELLYYGLGTTVGMLSTRESSMQTLVVLARKPA